MISRNIKTLFIMMSLIAVILACSLPGVATETVIPAVQDTVTAPAAASPPPPTDTSAPPPTEIVIQHQQLPVDLPADRSSHAGDYDSSITASQKTAGGDRFTFERFERPFNANTMDVYFSQLDIVDTFVFQDNTWIYGTITLQGPDASNALTGKYALELDLDVNGKGDWLIIAANPASTDWKVEGVQVYQDANRDVGLELPMLTDEGAAAGGDGFESLVFDQGIGDDPDTAWVRVSPKDPNTVEIAVKRSILGNPAKYLINMWAGTSLLDPVLFDINDHFTHEQAGAADKALEFYYPIKSVFELDNSCRMAVGFQPTGQEAGLCEVFVPQVFEDPTQQVCTLTARSCGNFPFDPARCCCTNALTGACN